MQSTTKGPTGTGSVALAGGAQCCGSGADRANARQSGGMAHLSPAGVYSHSRRSASETRATVSVRLALAAGRLGMVSGPHGSPARAAQYAAMGLLAIQRAARSRLGESGAVVHTVDGYERTGIMQGEPSQKSGRRRELYD
jgi:hypothetical protein